MISFFALLTASIRLIRSGLLDHVIAQTDAPRPVLLLHWLVRLVVAWRLTPKMLTRDEIPSTIEHLGPAYVKFGQFIATRPDIVGEEMANSLASLQDDMPAASLDEVRNRIEQILEQPLDDVFQEFGPAIAAASLAQVHFATLQDGREVAVKLLRPRIRQRFDKDLRLLESLAAMAELLIPASRRLKPKIVVEVLRSWVIEETDLRMEAAAMALYSDQLVDEPLFVTPEPIWDFCNRELLVTSRLSGTPLTKRNEIMAMDVDHTSIANALIRLFLSTATQHGAFHGDMHPGNIFINEDGRIGLLDFGLMGRIDRDTSRYLAEILHGFLERDYDRVARLHFEAGYVPANRSQAAFAQALRGVGEPIFGRSSEDISMGRVLTQLFDITDQFGMQTQPQLILLQKTMMTVEGVARSLSPESNIWNAAEPVIEDWMRRSLGPVGRLQQFVELAEKAGTWLDREISRGEQPKPHLDNAPFWQGLAVGLAAGLFAILLLIGLS